MCREFRNQVMKFSRRSLLNSNKTRIFKAHMATSKIKTIQIQKSTTSAQRFVYSVVRQRKKIKLGFLRVRCETGPFYVFRR